MKPRLVARTSMEWLARFFLLFLLSVVLLGIVAARRGGNETIILHGSMPEGGGWQPSHLTAQVREPLNLRLTSDDVVHGFAVGVGPDGEKPELAEVEVKPGQMTELTLTFDQPGTYTYVCTRWCGPNHWRMRGTIEVEGDRSDYEPSPVEPPLYVQLGIDIDAPHPAAVVPESTPSTVRGAALNLNVPDELLSRENYMNRSPVDAWLALRGRPELSQLDDMALWDAAASLWRRQTNEEALALGEMLYSQNCAACHGEGGAGDGVFAEAGAEGVIRPEARGHEVGSATDFTRPDMLGASNALLQGKILRGGMGTGMPAWGPIFTEQELQALLDYLWTFQFAVDGPDDADSGGNHAP
jgi:mono/diheme cytochrome c family protein